MSYLLLQKIDVKRIAKIPVNTNLTKILPFVDIIISTDETSEIKLIPWSKDLAIPVGYGASANDFITVVTDVPAGETVMYYLPKENNKKIGNSAHDNVILIDTLGTTLVNDLSCVISLNINIKEVANYRSEKLANTLISTKSTLEELLIETKRDYYNSNLEHEYAHTLALINKELIYYKENYPEYLI